MLVTASWFEDFKRTLGIQGVSQVWGDRPAWYFWIGGAPGAYQLQLEDAEMQPGGGYRGVFLIRCYPFTDTAFYAGFSAEERGVVESGLFDHTRTPRAEFRRRIPGHLFNVAVFELALQADGTAMGATLESLDRMIVRNAGPVPRTDRAAGETGLPTRGEPIRNVSAWALAYPLFDCLVCLWVNYRRQKPLHIRMTRDSGFETILDPPRQPVCRDTDAIGVYTLEIAFDARSGDHGQDPGREDGSDRGSVIFEHHAPCGHFHPPGTTVPLIGALNPGWWSLADTRFTCGLATTCGCAHDH
jgi:hypothetical protein